MSDDQDIYLRDMLSGLMRRKATICIVAGMTLLGGWTYALFATPIYVANATVRPVAMDSLSGGLSKQLGSAASLMGVSLGSSGGEAAKFRETLKSRELALLFIKRNNILPDLFPNRWDNNTKSWKQPSRSFTSSIKTAVSDAIAHASNDFNKGRPKPGHPTLQDGYKLFSKKVLSIREDNKTDTITVEMSFPNPVLAQKWANAYVDLANAVLREQAIAEAKRAIAHYDQEYERTTVSRIRDSINDLRRAQLEKVVFAKSKDQYAFQVIDRAVEPEDYSYPKRPLIFFLSPIVGLFLGLFVAALLEIFSLARRSTPADAMEEGASRD